MCIFGLFVSPELWTGTDQTTESGPIPLEGDLESPREGIQAESSQRLPAASSGHGQRHPEFKPIRSGGNHEC